jgi:hypothetical protein
MRWLSGRQGSARPPPSPKSGSPISPARHQATPICRLLLPEPRTGCGSVGQRPGKDPLTCGDGVGLRGLEPRTSSLSDPTTNYADVIQSYEAPWRIMENAQVEATVDTRTDLKFLTVLPCLLGFLRQVVAARLLPCRRERQGWARPVETSLAPGLRAVGRKLTARRGSQCPAPRSDPSRLGGGGEPALQRAVDIRRDLGEQGLAVLPVHRAEGDQHVAARQRLVEPVDLD